MRRGTQGNGGMPTSKFQCSDGAIMITSGNDKQYNLLCDLVGHPALATDPRFHTNVERVKNRDEITEVFDAIFATNTMGYWLEKLGAAGIPSGPINDLEQVFAYPQAVHRGMRVRAPHPLKPDLDVIRSPLNFATTPITKYRAPPTLGEHTAAVLRDELGLDDAAIEALRADNII